MPQGAASLSLAVLESDGRKREGSSDEQCGLAGRRKVRGKTRDGDNVRAIPRLTVGKETVAYARQSAPGLAATRWRLEESRREKSELAQLRNGRKPGAQENGREKKVGLPRRRDATLFFDGADRRGLGGEPIAGSLLAARRGASRFQNRGCSGEDAGRALIGNFLFGF